MPVRFTGGCHCGEVRYVCTAEAVSAGHCQCSDCRKLSGTGHTSALRVPEGEVTITGEPKRYDTVGDRGNSVQRHFCANCGAPVFSRADAYPGLVNLRASSLDDPEIFKPQRVVFTASAPSWDLIDSALPRFPRMPPG